MSDSNSSVALDVKMIETFNKCKCGIMCNSNCADVSNGEANETTKFKEESEQVRDEKENQQCENMCSKKVAPCPHMAQPPKTPLAIVCNDKKIPAHVPSRLNSKENASDSIENNLSSSDNSLLLCPSLADPSYSYLNFPRPKMNNDFPMNDTDSELLDDITEGTSIYGESENDGESEASSYQAYSNSANRFSTEILNSSSTQVPESSSGNLFLSLTNTARPLQEDNTEVAEPALRNSLFPFVSPTINFCCPGVKVEKLPDEVCSLLKWKLTVVTPIIVKKTVTNSNFKLTKLSNRWVGIWSKHIKSLNFNNVKYYQKMNHFPGTSQIGRKDRLWLNLSRLRSCHGRVEFDFFPKTYLLPKDTEELKLAWSADSANQKWIVKPPASARGCGIKVIHKIEDLPTRRPLIVQKYLSRPYLIDGSKFDLRLYVYVASFDPLRIYLYPEGLVRFASVKYTHDVDSLDNNFIHLTNFSINRLNTDYVSNSDSNSCEGHKWTISALWDYLRKRGVDTDVIWTRIVDIVIKAVISCESTVNFLTKANVRSKYNCHELFGFDVMLDENLKPWLIEVNISPSLHSSSPLDVAIKSSLVKDVFNIAGYQIPDKLSPELAEELREKYCSGNDTLPSVYLNKYYYWSRPSNDEKDKAVHYAVQSRDEYLGGILYDLSPSDVRHLIESEDELARKGNFLRVFPMAHTYKYHKYFETSRYTSHLLDAWENRYSECREKGIARLTALCLQQEHLKGMKKGGKKVTRSVSNMPNTKLNKVKRCTAAGCMKARTTLTTCNCHAAVKANKIAKKPASPTSTPPSLPANAAKSTRKRPPGSPLTNSESMESSEVEC